MAADWAPSQPLDLGGGHQLRFTGPADGQGHPIGVIERHPRPDTGQSCEGSLLFDTAPDRFRTTGDGSARPTWHVESWEPLTLSPSILCTACGNHGFVRDGRWAPA